MFIQKSMDDEQQIVANAENLLIQQLQLLDVELALAHDFIGIWKNNISSNLNYRVPKILHIRCLIKFLKNIFSKYNVIIMRKDSL